MVLADSGVGGDLPLRLGGANVAHRDADGFDVYIDGIPFLLYINDQVAYSDKTADWKKQQFDNSPEPGEQTLSDWWAKSQISFDGGVQQRFLDSYANADDISRSKWWRAFNVEMQWPLGQVTACPAAVTLVPQSGGVGAGFIFPFVATSGDRAVLATDGGNVVLYTDAGGGAESVTLAVSSLPIQSAATDGESLFCGTADGVYRVDQDQTVTKLYDLSASQSILLGWSKVRLMLAVGPTVYELQRAPASTVLPDPLYTHPTPGWQWTCFTDGLTSILAAGFAGPQSHIMEFGLDTSSGAPQLGGAQVAATMPTGEVCYAVQNHSGAFVAIGTSKGVRIGHYDSYYGHFTYGPLSALTDRPVRALAADQSYIYFGIESLDGYSSTLGKVDLGSPVDQAGRYAWSPSQPPPQLTQSPVRFITTDGDGRLLFNVDGIGVCRQSPGVPTALPAFLVTSKIRVGTLEPKAFRYVTVRGELPDGESITVTPTVAGTELPAATVLPSNLDQQFQVGATGEWCQLQFNLSPGATMTGYVLYALPAQRRYRQMEIPVWVANSEKSRAGRVFQAPRWAQERYMALREIESRGDEVELRFPALGYDVARGVIDSITFVQTEPPTDRGANGMCGVAQVVFRTTR